MLKIPILIVTSILALSFIACSSVNIQKEEKTNKPNVSLKNTYWKVISFYDKEVQVIRKEAHIKFDDNGSINGFLGCNNFFGNFKIDKDNITFEKVASTRMMCQNMQTEDSFLKVLQNTKKYKIIGESLSFFDEKNEKISTFKAVYF